MHGTSASVLAVIGFSVWEAKPATNRQVAAVANGIVTARTYWRERWQGIDYCRLRARRHFGDTRHHSASFHRNVAIERGYALQPGADVREITKREAAFAGNVGVGVERDVGERNRVADEPVAIGKVSIHQPQRRRSRH